MEKEDILRKSRIENRFGDERNKIIRTNRDAFSVWGMLAIGIVIMVVKLYRIQSPADIISIMFCTSATGFLYEAIKTKKKINIVFTVILYALALYFFYKFCVGKF